MHMKGGLARFLAGIVTAALLTGTVFAAGDSISVQRIANLADEYDISEDFVDAVYEEESDGRISVEDFQSLAQEHLVKSEYVQRFFSNCFVYRKNGIITYDPVDFNLPQNSYNADSFDTNGGIIDYYFADGSRAARGVDVSRYQGNIDWDRVANDGIDFAMIRIGTRGYTKGAIMLDAMAEENIRGALNAGLKVGVYFYSQAVSEWEAVEEAEAVLDVIRGYDITYPVVFDAEEVGYASSRTGQHTSSEWTDHAIAFCETIKNAGYTPMVYSYTNMYISKLDLERLKPYDKWVAQYYKQLFFPYDFQMWQYSCKGQVDGIQGPVDLNISFKNY